MPAVSNSSPLILYAKIGPLTLLRGVFGEIWIPPAVYREVVIEGVDRLGADEIRRAPWIVRMQPPEPLPATNRLPALDEGETEALALAV